MKMRIILIYSLFLLLGLTLGCSDDDNEDVNGAGLLPPGTEYVKEGEHCVNVVYYICKGLDTLYDWHRIYSECLRTIQSQYKEQMALCGYPDKTFNLEANVQSPTYVNIIRLEGQVDSVWKKVDFDKEINREVDAYFTQHPEKKSGMFTVIFVPQVEHEAVITKYVYGSEDRLMDCSLIFSHTTLSLSNTLIGGLMRQFGKLFFLDENTEPMSAIYYSMMNKDYGAANWGTATRLLKADAMWLNRNPVFCKNAVPGTEVPLITVTRADRTYENGYIRVSCEFTSSQPVAGVIVYNDPWAFYDRRYDIGDNNYTVGDAVPYAVEQLEKNGTGYQFTLEIPWSDLPANYTVPGDKGAPEAEIRFRFILESGMAVPVMNKGGINSGYRNPYKIKNYIPDFQDPVDVTI